MSAIRTAHLNYNKEYPNQTRAASVPADKQVVVGRPAVVAVPVVPAYPTYVFAQRGFYDYSGAYVTTVNGVNIPPSMYPPAGLCRIWVADRAPAAQSPVESCSLIETRVTPGAYVVYGG